MGHGTIIARNKVINQIRVLGLNAGRMKTRSLKGYLFLQSVGQHSSIFGKRNGLSQNQLAAAGVELRCNNLERGWCVRNCILSQSGAPACR